MPGDSGMRGDAPERSVEAEVKPQEASAAAAPTSPADDQQPTPKPAQAASPGKVVPSAAELAKLLRGLFVTVCRALGSSNCSGANKGLKAAARAANNQDEGPIDATKTVDDVRKEPYKLPNGFVWTECDLYQLLSMHYVEDDDNLFRFNYGREFLVWALDPPGAIKEWIIGVRVEATNKLVGFITAIPTALLCNGKRVEVAEVNFLCVHKKLRSKRLAPVREEPALEGLRPMKESDAPQVHKLLMTYLKNFKLHPDFTEEEIRHWLTPRENVVHVYAAYSFYNVATSVSLKELMQDALCLAKQKDFDVFNALDVMENKTLFEDLKFGVGDGFLRYYLYNWRFSTTTSDWCFFELRLCEAVGALRVSGWTLLSVTCLPSAAKMLTAFCSVALSSGAL
ncbi:hypothetical protein Emag_001591 [Eimeria magna]